MFLRRFLSNALVSALVAVGGPALAATYEVATEEDGAGINQVADVVEDNGNCTLREAFIAVTTRLSVDECPAGTGGDVILLKEGVTYPLDPAQGQIVLGGATTTGDNPVNINPSVRLGVIPLDAFDDTIKQNPVILAGANNRIFYIKSGASLTLDNVTLDGGASNPALTVNGGLALVEGGIIAQRHTIFRNGKALNGGALFFNSDTAAFSGSDVAFKDNFASANGGAIATISTSRSLFVMETFYFSGNQAQTGAAVYLDGARPTFGMLNGTIYNNQAAVADGGVIRLQAPDMRAVAINNITMAGNTGGGALSFNTTTGTSVLDAIINSVIVGNVGGGCVGDVAAISAARVAYVVHENNDCLLDADAFIQQGDIPGAGLQNDSAQANMTVLMGVNPVSGEVEDCPATLPAQCEPVELIEPENVWPAFFPSRTDSIGLVDGVPTLLDAAAPKSDTTPDQCSNLDQRGFERTDDCDVGAIEIIRAIGNNDEFVVIRGTSEVIDVLANDVGDAQVDCSVLGAGCMTITRPPLYGTVDVTVDGDGVPIVTYTAPANFHGVDSFRYLVMQEAFVGADTYADTDVGALTNIRVLPASGLQDDDGIGVGALSGFWAALVLIFLGLFRRAGAHVSLVVLGFLATTANAVEIEVNDLSDSIPSVYGDGLCTLREALANVQDSAPNPSPDCKSGATGRDIILLPAGVIQLQGPLDAGPNTVVDIIGKGADDATVGGEFSVIDAQGGSRVFLLRSPTALYDMIIENGVAVGGDGGAIITDSSLRLQRVVMRNNAAVSGGAIYVSFNSQIDRTVEVYRSEFRDNTASLNGGVFSMNTSDLTHNIHFAETSFFDNEAQGHGGALDINLPARSAFRVINSTFARNSAVSGRGDAIDMGDIAGSAFIVNSTFVDHDAAVDLGDIDPVAVDARMANSVYVGTASSGSCSTGTGRFRTSEYNVFAGIKDSTCDSSGDVDNNTYPLSELQALLGSAAEVSAAGQSEDFVPGHFPIDPDDANALYLMDAGNGDPDELITDFNRPEFCRSVDTRGVSRSSGGQCDIGAYEVLQSTAVDDEASNQGRPDHVSVINVLNNDIAGDGLFLVPYAIDLQPSGPGDTSVQTSSTTAFGTLRLVEKEELDPEASYYDPQQACGADVGTNGAGAKECLVRYELTNPPIGGCAALESFEDTFQYSFIANETDLPENAQDFTASNPVPSNIGTVTVEIANVAPSADDVSVASQPGETVVFPFVIADPEGDLVGDFKLTQEPIAALYDQVNQERVYLGVGVIVDQAGGTVTYIPASGFSPFNDQFTLSYTDSCGAKGSTTFKITYPREDSSGDVLGGASGVISLLSLILLARRRRPKS